MGRFQNLNIRSKLIFGFSIAVILLAVVGYMGILGTGKIDKTLDNTLAIRLPSLDYLVESDRDLQQLLVAERSMIFANAQSEVFKKLVADYEENLQQSEDRMKKYEALAATVEEHRILTKYKKDRKAWYAISKQIVDGRKADTREGRRLAIDLSLSQADQAFEVMRESLNALQELNLKMATELSKNSQSTHKQTLITIIALTGAAILIVLILLALMNRTVTRPLNDMVNRTRELAEGQADLTRRLDVSSNDEVGNLGKLFNKFIERIQGIITNVKTGAGEIIESTESIARGSEELASRTNEQAASVTETSTTLEEFTAIVRQNSDNAADANDKIKNFNQQVQDKQQLIRDVTQTMNEIDRSSNQIGNIMNVINDISFQTNLLALNAAVEAARAGEAGRGFAVVASEVRNLAQKTAESSKSIQEIVDTNVTSTQKGMELVKDTETFFESIMDILSQLANIVGDIENGSREQASGMEQINDTVIQLEKVINQNAELVNSFASTGKEMNVNAGQLQELMSQFRTSEKEQQQVLTGKEEDKPPAKPSIKPSKTSAAKPAPEKKAAASKGKTKTEPKPPPPKKQEEAKAGGGDDDDFFASDEGEFEEF